MGFFFGDPADHIKHSELKKELKSMRVQGHISARQHDELLAHIEEHGRESYSRKHIHEIIRRKKDAAGDSFNTDQLERVERRLAKTIEDRIPPKEIRVTETPSANEKVVNIREYRSRRPQSIETPKADEPASKSPAASEPESGPKERLDIAA
jgi:hypothetical protein